LPVVGERLPSGQRLSGRPGLLLGMVPHHRGAFADAT